MTKTSLQSHIDNDDYFGTIATILSLIRESIENIPKKDIVAVLDNLEKDLMILQKKYKIIKKVDISLNAHSLTLEEISSLKL